MDLVTEKPSLDVEVECFVNSLIVDVLEDLELENRKQWNNAKLNICDKSESHTDSVVSSVSSTVPSLKVLACDAVKNADAKACERHGILRFMGSNSENSSSSLCSSLSPTFSDLSQRKAENTPGWEGGGGWIKFSKYLKLGSKTVFTPFCTGLMGYIPVQNM